MQFEMRKIHRWVAVTVSILLLIVAITGVVLQVQKLTNGGEEEDVESFRGAFSTATTNNAYAVLLERTVNAARTAAQGAPVASIELRLSGDIPEGVVTMPGEPGRRIIINAQTGKVTSDEEYERESLFLRIHSGEILGEPGVVLGVLWGLGLTALSLTGIWMYLVMYAKRRAARGKGQVFWLALLLLPMMLKSNTARAGAPFLTDDPGFVAQGWEIRPQSSYEDNVNGTVTNGALDLNYTIVPTFKVNLTIGEKWIDPVGAPSVHGVADTDFKFKWRFLEEDQNGWMPAMSVAPNVTFPTASSRRGLGDGAWRYRLPMQFGKTFGDYYTFAELGYQWAASNSASDQAVYGIAIQRALASDLTIGIELNGSAPTEAWGDYGVITNVGVSYVISDHVQLLGSIGRTLRDTDHGGPEFLGQIFLQFNFGS